MIPKEEKLILNTISSLIYENRINGTIPTEIGGMVELRLLYVNIIVCWRTVKPSIINSEGKYSNEIRLQGESLLILSLKC
jgi:hypothetical protein